MKIEFHPNLIESAVFLKARADRSLEREFHRAIDPLYELPPGPEREDEFQSANAKLFTRFDLGAPLVELLDERPSIGREVAACLVTPAERRGRESAELMVRAAGDATSPEQRTLVIQVCAESLVRPETMTAWMRRELMHVHDMVDPAFGYLKELIAGRRSQQDLIRDRFRVLWSIYVECRLMREGKAEESSMKKLRVDLARVYPQAGDGERETILTWLAKPDGRTHGELLQAAQKSQAIPEVPSEEPISSAGGPGAICPLCSLPAFDWFDFSVSPAPRVMATIESARPEWRLEQGACRQCAELYDATAQPDAPIAAGH